MLYINYWRRITSFEGCFLKLAIGNTFFKDLLSKDEELNKLYIIYPRFYDNKKLLLSAKGYGSYLLKLWSLKDKIEYAVYPDNVRYLLFVPRNITYIYVIHDIDKDSEAYFNLKKELKLIAGYASDEQYRNYTIEQYLERFRNEPKWYLGISAKRELREAVEHHFDYGDITLMALGSFKDIRTYGQVRERLFKFYELKENLEKQTKIEEFRS